MKIVYTEMHRRHAPPYEFSRGAVRPLLETPARVDGILCALRDRSLGDIVAPRQYSLAPMRTVHDSDYLHYLENIHGAWMAEGRVEIGVIPDTFAVRTMDGRPDRLVYQAGYYCFDAQTPIVEGTYEAALSSAYCALTGADMLLSGESAVYALCRPPGHHAGRDIYGGYCYLNNAAIAATRLSRETKIALLDIDYHHGNGTQDIFYDSSEVLYVSLHVDPNGAFPLFSGFPDECGTGGGFGLNRNLPLPSCADERRYLGALDEAIEIVQQFGPGCLVVSLGGDILRDDPLAGFDLSLKSFSHIGDRIAHLQLPTLLVQEGGYNVQLLGESVVNMLQAFV